MKGFDFMTKYTMENVTRLIFTTDYNALKKELAVEGFKFKYMDTKGIFYLENDTEIIAVTF